MSKFKVGDKVRIKGGGDNYLIGTTAIVLGVAMNGYMSTLNNGWLLGNDLLEAVDGESIVIVRDGKSIVAAQKRGRLVTRAETATCDDFETGAKLAFDRLMGREEPKPQPAPMFKVGDRVVTSIGAGTVVEVDPEIKEGKPYHIRYDNGCILWKNSNEAKPAPEPKYYSGKVFAVDCINQTDRASVHNRCGHVFEIVDGKLVGDMSQFGMDGKKIFHSFEDVCQWFCATNWQEVKQ